MVGALDLKYRSKVKTLQTSAGKNTHLGIIEGIKVLPAPTRAIYVLESFMGRA